MGRQYMNAQDFREEGFLQEVNRQFFHPLGLALAVYVDDEGFDDCFSVSIWDARDDPEGWFFAEHELSQEKADKVETLMESKRVTRNIILGHDKTDASIFGCEPIQGIGEVAR